MKKTNLIRKRFIPKYVMMSLQNNLNKKRPPQGEEHMRSRDATRNLAK